MTPHTDVCGARTHRTPTIAQPDLSGASEVALTPLGRALLEVLAGDDRFRKLVSEPFEQEGPAAA